MSTISIDQVKELRDQTGVSVMQCRKALEEAGGDREKALMIIKKQAGVAAAKRSDRGASAGTIVAKKEGRKVVAVILNCETDFVAKNGDFLDLANKLLAIAFTEGKAAAEAKAPEMIADVIQKTGENVKLGGVFELTSERNVGLYIHDGRLGTVVELDGGTEALAKDLAMHISAMKPEYIRMEDVPAEMTAQAKEIFLKEVDTTKPADMQEKILAGKIDAYFRERTLENQEFFKDTSKKVKDVLTAEKATIASFTPLSVA